MNYLEDFRDHELIEETFPAATSLFALEKKYSNPMIMASFKSVQYRIQRDMRITRISYRGINHKHILLVRKHAREIWSDAKEARLLKLKPDYDPMTMEIWVRMDEDILDEQLRTVKYNMDFGERMEAASFVEILRFRPVRPQFHCIQCDDLCSDICEFLCDECSPPPPIQGCEPPPLSFQMRVRHVIDDICPICQSIEPADRLAGRCGHYFHPGCLVHWARANHTCPVCKSFVF